MNQMLLEWLNTRDPYVQYCHIDKLPAFREWFRRQLSLLGSTGADDSETSSYLAQCEALSLGKTKKQGSFSAAPMMQELPDIFPEEEDWDEEWYEEEDDDDDGSLSLSLSLSIHTHTQQRYDKCRKASDQRPSNSS